MSDIRNQLIKDSYNYVLQSDLSTGVVYRIGGDIPVNPIFQSGLTINSGFTYSNGTEQLGYVMTCDAFGNANWAPASAATPSSGVTSVTAGNGLSGNVTTGAITLINTAPDQTVTISGGTGITTGGTYPNFTIVNSAPDRTVTLSGGTNIGVLGTYPDFSISFTGSIPTQGITGITGTSGVSASTTDYGTTIVNTAPDRTVTLTGGTNIQITGTYPDFGINFTGTTGVSGDYLPLSGGTLTGGLVANSGITANTISATTYFNLPVSGLTEGNNISITGANGNFRISFTGTTGSNFTGGTVSGATIFTNGLTANTISATTYQNLPVSGLTGGNNISVTGSNGNFTISFTGTTGSNFTGGTVSGATIFTDGLTANTISATTYYNVSSNFQYEIHVSQVDGNDTTGDGSLLSPVASITQALTLLTGSRKTIIVHPGGYNESPTVTSGNTTIATSELTGANTVLYGTLTIGSLGSGSRISGLKMSNLLISGTAQAYISNCTVDNNVTKSSSGYVEIINSEMQCTLGIQISGAGITIINGNKNAGVSVSNASAQVIIKGCNSVVTPSATAGNLAIVDCIVTALGGNAITITNSATTLTLGNSQVLVQAGDNVAPISVAGIYSIFNTIYDKPNSTLSGTSTNSIDYFQYINADKFITQGGTSLQYVMGDGSLSNGFTGGTVSGATNFTGGLSANTISATTYYNLPVSAVTNGDGISASTSGGVVTITNTRPQGITGITANDGLSGNTTNFATIIINTDKGSSQNIFKNIQIGGITQFGANSNNSNLNFSGIGITITSGANNTLIFSAGTGGGGAVSSVTAGSGLSGNSTTGAITLINTQVQGITGITSGAGITATTTNNVTTITNLGVTGITAGYGVSANTSTGNVTIEQVFDYGKAYTTGNNLNYI